MNSNSNQIFTPHFITQPLQQFMETDGGMTRIFEYNPRNSIHFQTNKQLIQILDTTTFGPTLFLDGILQSSSKDEYIYHEMLVHPMMSCLDPDERDRIAIFGGGEGCTAKTVFRWPFTNHVNMYDYDNLLVDYFKNNDTPWNTSETLNDSRLRILYRDVFREVRNEENGRFNGLIIDLTDPEPTQKWVDLINTSFHWLHPTGAMVINAGGLYPWDMKNLEFIYRIAQDHIQSQNLDFKLHAYKVFVPSFGREWGFVLVHYNHFNTFQLNDPAARYYSPQKVMFEHLNTVSNIE